MSTIRYVHWQEGDHWLGYLEEYPDYWTQGESLEDLLDHLRDLYLDLSQGAIPGARKVGELVLQRSGSIECEPWSKWGARSFANFPRKMAIETHTGQRRKTPSAATGWLEVVSHLNSTTK